MTDTDKVEVKDLIDKAVNVAWPTELATEFIEVQVKNDAGGEPYINTIELCKTEEGRLHAYNLNMESFSKIPGFPIKKAHYLAAMVVSGPSLGTIDKVTPEAIRDMCKQILFEVNKNTDLDTIKMMFKVSA